MPSSRNANTPDQGYLQAGIVVSGHGRNEGGRARRSCGDGTPITFGIVNGSTAPAGASTRGCRECPIRRAARPSRTRTYGRIERGDDRASPDLGGIEVVVVELRTPGRRPRAGSGCPLRSPTASGRHAGRGRGDRQRDCTIPASSNRSCAASSTGVDRDAVSQPFRDALEIDVGNGTGEIGGHLSHGGRRRPLR